MFLLLSPITESIINCMQNSKPSEDEIAAYRLKIKKLKYKIELE